MKLKGILGIWAVICLGLGLSGCASESIMMEQERIKNIQIPIKGEVEHIQLSTQGEIPLWLQGTFVRNGPVSIEIDDEKIHHWFDGLAMLHAFTFHEGKVTYTNKFLKTDAYKTVFMQGSLNYLGFDSLPPHPMWDRIKAFINPPACPPIQNANVNLTKIANRCVALTEIPLPLHFDLKTLDTLEALQFQDDLPQENSFESAHPQHDKHTGEQFNYIVDFGLNTKYLVYRYHPSIPCRQLIGEIPVQKPAYMHSFAITEHYIILVEYPLVVSPINLFFLNKPFIENYQWQPERGTTFLIIDRKSGQLVREIKDCMPFFAFHHVNAFEEKDNIILDIVIYNDARIVSDISQHGYLTTKLGIDENLPFPKLTRFTVSMCDNQVHSKVIFDGSFELPRINEKYNAHPYRYAYGSDQRLLMKLDDLRPIYKIDTRTGQKWAWEEAGVLPGEPVFIPDPHGKAEDDGVILSIVLDNSKQNAFLLILDAKNFKEIGRAFAPFSIPLGLHGQYF